MAETLTLPATIEASQVKTGMTVRIHQKIKETGADGKEKERVQVYEGLVTNVRGSEKTRSMTVRKVSGGIGVEKIYPLNLPSIEKIELTRMLKVRRNNINFVRKSKKRMKEVKQVKLSK